MRRNHFRYLLVILAFFFALQHTYAQNKRQVLEQKRKELRAKIQRINKLLDSNKAHKQSILSQAQSLEERIEATEALIRTNNQAANLLTRKINNNQHKITSLRQELEKLKEDYSEMMRQTYRSRSQQSRLMFLFSSESFLQAYKRLKYMEQYAEYREEQGEKIKAHAKELQRLNLKLADQREDKKKLIAQNRETKKQLQADKKQKEALIAKITAEGSEYKQQINQLQQEIAKVDAKIQAAIRAAIARENKKHGSSARSKFALTPEAKALAASFASNKGKLPWPVKYGDVTIHFGTNPSPLVPSIPIHSNGIRIATNKMEPVHAVFKGKILKIQVVPNSNKAIYIQHGNYISLYSNLARIYVHTGDEVSTGDIIGKVGRSVTAGRPILRFSIYKDTKALDPMHWILNR